MTPGLLKETSLVALGGAFGSVLRYLIVKLAFTEHTRTPWAVMSINLFGSFLIGVAAGYFAQKPNSTLHLLLSIGILGGFTTFSSFSLDNLTLVKQGHYGLALINVLAQCLLGVLFAALGFALAPKTLA